MNEQGYRVGVGASSVLMIFVVLSLTTLGVLSFASARANQTLTARRTAHVEGYYEASAVAQRALAEIDALLMAAPEDDEAYAAYVKDMDLSGLPLSVSDGLLLSFAVPCGDAQELRLSVKAAGPGVTPRYRVTRQGIANAEVWTDEDDSWNLPVMDFDD